MKRTILLILLFFISLAQAEDKTIIAKYKDKIITDKDLERIISYYESTQKMAINENPQLKLSVLRQIITNNIVSSIAEEKGFTKRDDIKEQIKLITEHFITSLYLKEEVLFKVSPPTEEDIKNYYNLHLNEFIETPEQVRARHILLRIPPNTKDEEKKAVIQRAEKIIKQIKEGADFGEMAKLHSDDPGSKNKGGDLGFFTRGRMVKPFEDAVFSLKIGEISSPIITNFGVHIIKVEDRKEATYKPFEKVKKEVEQKALEKKQKEKVLEYLENLFKSEKVQINENYFLKQK